jgi:hypothetical protein
MDCHSRLPLRWAADLETVRTSYAVELPVAQPSGGKQLSRTFRLDP